LADLEGLLRLPAGWNSYRARPIAAQAVWGALQLLRYTMPLDAPKPAVVPTVRGGVQLEWHARGVDLEVEALPDGRYTMAFEDDRTGTSWEHEHAEDVEPVRAALFELARR
jgi:hypothetical protein